MSQEEKDLDLLRKLIPQLHLTAREKTALWRIVDRGLISAPKWHVALVDGQIRLRGDEGPTGKLKDEEQFLRINDELFPIRHLLTGPPVLLTQVQINKERVL